MNSTLSYTLVKSWVTKLELFNNRITSAAQVHLRLLLGTTHTASYKHTWHSRFYNNQLVAFLTLGALQLSFGNTSPPRALIPSEMLCTMSGNAGAWIEQQHTSMAIMTMKAVSFRLLYIGYFIIYLLSLLGTVFFVPILLLQNGSSVDLT